MNTDRFDITQLLPRNGISLYRCLILLVLITLLPVILTGLITMWIASNELRDTSANHLQNTAYALAQVVTDEINHNTSLMTLLANSEKVDIHDKKIVNQWLGSTPIPKNSNVHIVTTTTENTVFRELLLQLQAGKNAAISNIFATEQHPYQLAVAVPYIRTAGEFNALVLQLAPQDFIKSLQNIVSTFSDSDLLAAVTDGSGYLVSRSLDQENTVGLPVPDWDVLQALGGEQGTFFARTQEGNEVVFAFRILQNTPGWVVVVGESARVFNARWQRPLIGIAIGGLIAAFIALLAASYLAKHILRPVTVLVQRSKEVIEKDQLTPQTTLPSRISEFEALQNTLALTEQALRQRADDAQRLAESLSASEQRYRAIAHTSALVFWRQSTDGTLLELTGWQDLTGQKEQNALLQNGWLRYIHPHDLSNMTKVWRDSFSNHTPVDVEFRIKNADKKWHWVRARGAILQTGSLSEYAGVLEDIHSRKVAEERIVYTAQHDMLTGLANRILFQDKLEEALLHSRRGQISALLSLDLDLFKNVNDTYGHLTGDALLCEVASRLRETGRQTDIIARLGGDEFAILQRIAKQPDAAIALASRLVTLIAKPYFINGYTINIGVSIGIAIIDDRISHADRIRQHADLALYSAKNKGKSQFCCFEPEMLAEQQNRLQDR